MTHENEQNRRTELIYPGSSIWLLFSCRHAFVSLSGGGVHVAPRCQLHVHHATWCCSGDVRMSGLSCLDMSGIVLVGLMVSIPLESTTNGNIRPFCQPIIGGSLHLDILYIYILPIMSHVPIFYWRPLPPPKMASTIASAGPRRANTASSCAQTTVLGAATFQSSVAAAGFAMVIGLV